MRGLGPAGAVFRVDFVCLSTCLPEVARGMGYAMDYTLTWAFTDGWGLVLRPGSQEPQAQLWCGRCREEAWGCSPRVPAPSCLFLVSVSPLT